MSARNADSGDRNKMGSVAVIMRVMPESPDVDLEQLKTVLKQKLPERKRRRIEILINGFILLFAVLVMIIGGIYLVNLTFDLHQISAALQLKLGYVYLAVPLSGVIMVLYSLLNIAGLMKNGKEV